MLWIWLALFVVTGCLGEQYPIFHGIKFTGTRDDPGMVTYSFPAEPSAVPLTRTTRNREAAIQDYPYTVAIHTLLFGTFWTFTCGGSLVRPNKVLTAAHCITITKELGGGEPLPMRVMVGSQSFITNSEAQIIGVKKAYYHPYFNDEEREKIHPKRGFAAHDVAVLELETDAVLSDRVQLIPLAHDLQSYEGKICQVAGYGISGTASTSLMVRNETIVSLSSCQKIYAEVPSRKIYIRKLHICGRREESQNCVGDSGSALVCDGVQVGIVSFGAFPCVPNVVPNGYASVPYEYPLLNFYWVAKT